MERRASRSCFRFSLERSMPSNRTVPSVGISSIFIQRTSVLFPAPLIPIMPKISPCSIFRVDVLQRMDLRVFAPEGFAEGANFNDRFFFPHDTPLFRFHVLLLNAMPQSVQNITDLIGIIRHNDMRVKYCAQILPYSTGGSQRAARALMGDSLFRKHLFVLRRGILRKKAWICMEIGGLAQKHEPAFLYIF